MTITDTTTIPPITADDVMQAREAMSKAPYYMIGKEVLIELFTSTRSTPDTFIVRAREYDAPEAELPCSLAQVMGATTFTRRLLISQETWRNLAPRLQVACGLPVDSRHDHRRYSISMVSRDVAYEQWATEVRAWLKVGDYSYLMQSFTVTGDEGVSRDEVEQTALIRMRGALDNMDRAEIANSKALQEACQVKPG